MHKELEMALTFIQGHPESAARELESLPIEHAVEVFTIMPLPSARKFLGYLLSPFAARLIIKLPGEQAIDLLSASSINRLASILRCLSKPKRNAILKKIPDKTATLCRALLSYSEDTVGAWMEADIIMLRNENTAEEALQRLSSKDGASDTNAIPVVDKNQHLCGQVSIRDLLRAKPEMSMKQLMRDAPANLMSRTSLASASRHSAWRTQNALAVLNHSRQLVGMLNHAELTMRLERYQELNKLPSHSDLIGEVGAAYLGSMNALLGLVSGQSLPKLGRGKQ